MRVFVGLEIPSAIRARLAGLQAGVPGARWVRPDNLHLTLLFLGELDGAALGDLDQMLASVIAAPFDLSVSGVGQFGGRRGSRAVWAGVAPSPELEQLQARVASAVARAGIAAETRRFVPHVTLAWLRSAPDERVARFLSDNAMLQAGPWEVRRMVLYSSHAGPDGNDYRPEATYGFGTGGDGEGGEGEGWDGDGWDGEGWDGEGWEQGDEE